MEVTWYYPEFPEYQAHVQTVDIRPVVLLTQARFSPTDSGYSLNRLCNTMQCTIDRYSRHAHDKLVLHNTHITEQEMKLNGQYTTSLSLVKTCMEVYAPFVGNMAIRLTSLTRLVYQFQTNKNQIVQGLPFLEPQ